MSTHTSPLLKKLSTRYTLIRGVEVVLLAMAAGLLAWGITGLMWGQSSQIAMAIVAALVAGVLAAFRAKIFSPPAPFLIHYLNNRYPQVQASADLLLTEESTLSVIQKIQLARVQSQLQEIYPEIKLPHHLRVASLTLLGSAVVSALLMAFQSSSKKETDELVSQVQPTAANPQAAKLNALQIIITPPAYTGLASRKSENANLNVQEGSKVMWSAKFSATVQAWLVFSGRDSIPLTEQGGVYTTQKNIIETGFYQLAWRTLDKPVYTDFFKIEVINDQAPQIEITNLEQFTRLKQTDSWSVPVTANLRDDYGLTDAQIIATVSKGSGESVKFREEKLRFSSPQTISGKRIDAKLTLNLQTLGLEPGDELYFYVEARDNQQPASNYNRTETYFIAIQDTTQYQEVDEDGLGVDLMPEYFRSQRQIIIDTEKLLKEKKKISTQQFKSTSNELGYDQKVLRLRYGQFMGEEFEDQIGGAVVSPEELENETAEETAKRMSHQHDTENEHNLVEQKKPVADNHNHGEEKDQDDPLAAFAHQHDDGEVATFFIESMRTKLKAALTVMWDAELYLRLYEPEKSLPYQYTALKLLKEISNDSRIYVHRTGFEPPPLKEEKRLSGDLSEINSGSTNTRKTTQETYPAIRQARQILEQLIESNTAPTEAQKKILMSAGTELTAVVLEQPGKYLEGLSLLKAATEGSVLESEQRKTWLTLRKIFWQIVPESPATPIQKGRTAHPLDEQFLQNLVNR
ncbi:MAG: hypothetical protein E6Q41_03610 [Cyclobacteriaceae bacterium]|nr:MAG: hypothetical protein E6Q41_03610 [Cyclobacteriaceae bacterium]